MFQPVSTPYRMEELPLPRVLNLGLPRGNRGLEDLPYMATVKRFRVLNVTMFDRSHLYILALWLALLRFSLLEQDILSRVFISGVSPSDTFPHVQNRGKLLHTSPRTGEHRVDQLFLRKRSHKHTLMCKNIFPCPNPEKKKKRKEKKPMIQLPIVELNCYRTERSRFNYS